MVRFRRGFRERVGLGPRVTGKILASENSQAVAMETRKTCFQGKFHQEIIGKFSQPSSPLFTDIWAPNLVGRWRRVAKMGLGHWLPWQPHCCRVNLLCKLENDLMPKILG